MSARKRTPGRRRNMQSYTYIMTDFRFTTENPWTLGERRQRDRQSEREREREEGGGGGRGIGGNTE